MWLPKTRVPRFRYFPSTFQMIVCPAVVGGGKRLLPKGVRLSLELVEEQGFRKGVIFCGKLQTTRAKDE